MWVVYLIDASGSEWGHKYFNHLSEYYQELWSEDCKIYD